MIAWAFIGAAVLLLGATLRIWLDFGQRQRHLASEVSRLRHIISGHNEALATTRGRTKDLDSDTQALIQKREALHSEVIKAREALTSLEERLEKVKPKSHRVDNTRDDGEDDLF
jgi:chromosome segregation ATPase